MHACMHASMAIEARNHTGNEHNARDYYVIVVSAKAEYRTHTPRRHAVPLTIADGPRCMRRSMWNVRSEIQNQQKRSAATDC